MISPALFLLALLVSTTPSDDRLKQNVTYEASNRPVRMILTDLSGKTGVTLKAGTNENDWQVRDLRMNIFVKDMPLGSLMSSIARVMNFKWSRQGEEDKWTYRLTADRRAIEAAEAREAVRQARIEEQVTRDRQEMLDRFANSSGFTSDELEGIGKENEQVHGLITSGTGGALVNLFDAAPGLKEALANGQEFTLSIDTLPQAAWPALLGACRSLCTYMPGPKDEWKTPPADARQAIIQINPYLDSPDGFSLLNIGMKYNGADIQTDIMNRSPAYTSLRAELREEDKQWEDTDKRSFSEQPDDPSLHRKVEMKVDGKLLSDFQSSFVKESSIAIVSDSFDYPERLWDEPKPETVNIQETEIKALLNKAGDDFRCNWRKRGNIIEFRHRKWFSERQAIIPDKMVDKWRKTIETQGTLDIWDLADMAVLTKPQFLTNIMHYGRFSPCVSKSDLVSSSILVAKNRNLFSTYWALAPHKTQLFSAQGIGLHELSPDEKAVLEKLIKLRISGFLKGDTAITLKSHRDKNAKSFDYYLTASSSDEVPDIEWKITTPEFHEIGK